MYMYSVGQKLHIFSIPCRCTETIGSKVLGYNKAELIYKEYLTVAYKLYRRLSHEL